MDETLERIYTIPLRKVKWSSRNGQADRAIRAIRQYLVKHMKADEVWIDAAVNHQIWSRGKFKIPSKVRIRARLFDDGVCEVSLPEEETTTGESMREQMVEAKERKLEEAHKGELEALERAEAEGAATPSGLTRPTPSEEGGEEDTDAEDEEGEEDAAADESPVEPPEKPPEPKADEKPASAKKPAASAKKPAKADESEPEEAEGSAADEPPEGKSKETADDEAKEDAEAKD